MDEYKDYISLTEAESIVFADKIVEEEHDEDDLADILVHLALFTNGKCLQRYYPKLVERKIFYPGEIYLHADTAIATELIELIETKWPTENVDHLLVCLAWIGTENVVEFFMTSSNEKPAWTKKLYVLPIRYAEQAGWTTDAKNKKVELISRKVFALSSDKSLFSPVDRVQTFEMHEQKCPFCKNNLTTVFGIHLENKKQKTAFATCMMCSCYEPVFMTIDEEGKSNWYQKNEKWEHLKMTDNNEMEPITVNALKISIEKRQPEYAISQFVGISKSQIGGYPTWVQDSGYLDCPSCKQKMKFVGQVDMEDVEEYSEGIYYFHYCETCSISGSNYQQS